MSVADFLLVGLGNPGERYARTRHNAGFRFVEGIAEELGARWSRAPRSPARIAAVAIAGREGWLARPETFMNESGRAIGPLARYFRMRPTQVFVAYDDMDLPAGKFRIRTGGGHGGHNGVKSVIAHLGTADFVRLKFGIGRPPQGITPTDWVLGKATEEELAREARLFACVRRALAQIVQRDFARAMNDVALCMQHMTSQEG